ncbi:MAG: murein biosynthesis integral membrane protein MurJ [Thermoflexales bacterium]
MRLARAALVIGGSYVLSNLAGFLARILIAQQYGTGAEHDAFRAAFQVPDLLFSLLAGGALGSAFIPTFAARLATGKTGTAWALARRIALLTVGAMGGVAALAALASDALTARVVATGFDPASQALTAELMRIMLIGTVIFSLSGLLMGVLQSHESFLAPALAPAMYQFGLIAGATVLSGFGARGLAYGVVAGAFAHLLIQVPALLRLPRARPSPSDTAESRHDVVQVLRLMAPRMIGLGATRLNLVINTRLASEMGVGAVSAFDQAFAILVLPIAMAGQAVGTALFPSISAAAARGERAAFGASLTRALRMVIAFAAPATTGLILLGQPLIRLLFERGSFNEASTALVAGTLSWLAVGLIGHSALEIVTRGYYALKDSTRPAVFSVFSMAANVGLSLILARTFAAAGQSPVGGLALANALATLAETAGLAILLSRVGGALDGRTIVDGLLRSVGGSLVMALALTGWRALAGDGALATLAAIPLGGAVYLGAAWLLGSADARWLVTLARERLVAAPRR